MRGSSVAVFGLGEAGSAIAADLARHGATVTGYDPADRPDVHGVVRCRTPGQAADGADVVLAITAAADASTALGQATNRIGAGTLYADMSTAAPALKRNLAEEAASSGIDFVDVALMSSVSGKGLFTSALAAGPGAERYVRLMSSVAGTDVALVGPTPGDAATRKLLRSIVMKGLSAVLVESLHAAEAAGVSTETWENVVGEISAMDETFVRHLVAGTAPHAKRRTEEMRAAVALIEELGGVATMTSATVETLTRVQTEGLPSPQW